MTVQRVVIGRDRTPRAIRLNIGPRGPAGEAGAAGAAGPSVIGTGTATALSGVLFGNGANVLTRTLTFADLPAGLLRHDADFAFAAATAGAGPSRVIKGANAAAGNNAGGDVVFEGGTPSGTGTKGRVVVREPGGTGGFVLTAAAARSMLTSADGGYIQIGSTMPGDGLNVWANGIATLNRNGGNASAFYVQTLSTMSVALYADGIDPGQGQVRFFSGSGTHDAALKRTAAGELCVSNGATGFGALVALLKPPPFTFGTLPTPSTANGAAVRVTDRGHVWAYSDGAAWRRFSNDEVLT